MNAIFLAGLGGLITLYGKCGDVLHRAGGDIVGKFFLPDRRRQIHRRTPAAVTQATAHLISSDVLEK